MTLEQATEYLQSQGIDIPEFVLLALVEQANSVQECLDLHYTPGTAVLIQLYLVSLLGMAQGYKYVTSERAPNGAGRSFKYMTLSEHWSGISNLLRRLDINGCVLPLIPDNPNQSARAGLWVARAGCMGDDRYE